QNLANLFQTALMLIHYIPFSRSYQSGISLLISWRKLNEMCTSTLLPPMVLAELSSSCAAVQPLADSCENCFRQCTLILTQRKKKPLVNLSKTILDLQQAHC